MSDKIKFFFKWTFVFTILSLWTFLVLQSLSLGSAELFNRSNSLLPIYIQTSVGVEKASSSDLIDFLFNHDFEVEERNEFIPIKDCALRARGGTAEIDEANLGENNKLNFGLNYLGNGNGELTSQKGRERMSLSFKSEEILQTDLEKLVFKAKGRGHLNREELNFHSIIVTFDKENNKVNILGEGDIDFMYSNMEVISLDGCLIEMKEFLLLTDNGELPQRRTIEEVRQLLNENPRFTEAYENLRRLFSDRWFVLASSAIPIVS